MNQDKYSRLLETLKKCQFPEPEKYVEEFKQFMKHQQLNEKIDSMVDEAHKKKISDEEFAAMIEEQKQIMRDLGVKLKEPPSPVKKPVVNNLNKEPTKNEKPSLSESKPKGQGNTVKIYNMNEITNYRIEGDRFYIFGPNEEKVEKVKLNSGDVVSLDSLTDEQKNELSEDLEESETSMKLPPIIPNKILNTIKPPQPKPVKKLVPATNKPNVLPKKPIPVKKP